MSEPVDRHLMAHAVILRADIIDGRAQRSSIWSLSLGINGDSRWEEETVPS